MKYNHKMKLISADSGFGVNGDGLLAKKSGIFVNHQDYNKAALLCIPKCLRPLYLRYVALKNKLARINGFSDLGDQWRGRFVFEFL